MKMVLKSPNEAPYEAGKDFSIVIACADSSTVAPACEVLELIEENLTDEGRLFYQWWNFEVLTIHSLRKLAAAEAATADIIIIGLHGGQGLPQEVTDWMKQWLGLRNDRPGALVALLDADLKATGTAQENLFHLKQAAAFGRLDFFPTRAKEERDSGVARWASEAARQFFMARKKNAPGALPGDRRAARRCGAKKSPNPRRFFVNAAAQPNAALNHDEIARLAWQLWQAEGGQSGHDEEYWLRAERQLMATSQPGSNVPMNAPLKRKTASAKQMKSAIHPAVPAVSSLTSPQKRPSERV